MAQEKARLIESESGVPSQKHCQVAAGYVCACVGTVGFAASAGFSQALGGYVPTFELNLWRFGTQVLLALLVIVPCKMDIRIQREKIPWLIVLCLAYNGHNITFYESSIFLPVTEMVCINNVGGLTLSLLLASALYRICRIYEIMAVSVCVTGIVLVTQPHVLFGSSQEFPVTHPLCVHEVYQPANVSILPYASELQDSGNGTSENVSTNQARKISSFKPRELLGDGLAGASAACLVARVFVTNKKLQGIGPIVVAFWVAVSGVVTSSAAMLAFETVVLPSSSTCQLLVLGHAFSASLCALLATVGELNLHPTIFTLASTLETIILLMAQYTVLKSINPGRENTFEIVGAILVFLGCTAGPIYSMLKERWTDR